MGEMLDILYEQKQLIKLLKKYSEGKGRKKDNKIDRAKKLYDLIHSMCRLEREYEQCYERPSYKQLSKENKLWHEGKHQTKVKIFLKKLKPLSDDLPVFQGNLHSALFYILLDDVEKKLSHEDDILQ